MAQTVREQSILRAKNLRKAHTSHAEHNLGITSSLKNFVQKKNTDCEVAKMLKCIQVHERMETEEFVYPQFCMLKESKNKD